MVSAGKKMHALTSHDQTCVAEPLSDCMYNSLFDTHHLAWNHVIHLQLVW